MGYVQSRLFHGFFSPGLPYVVAQEPFCGAVHDVGSGVVLGQLLSSFKVNLALHSLANGELMLSGKHVHDVAALPKDIDNGFAGNSADIVALASGSRIKIGFVKYDSAS